MLRGGVVALALCATWAARAEEPAAPGDAAVRHPSAREAVRGDEGTFQLRDGRVIEGRLVATGEAADIIALPGGERLFLPGHSIVHVVPASPKAASPEGGLAPGEVRVFLRDGTDLRGRLLSRDDEALRLELPGGERRLLRTGDYLLVYGLEGQRPRLRDGVDAARLRTLWAPTALRLDHREVAATSELLGVGLAAGLFEHFVLTAGTTLPLAYAKEAGGNARLSARAVAPVLPWLHLGAGVDGFVSGSGTVVNGFLAATLGDEERFLSLYAGPPPTGADRLGHMGDRIFSAAACWRAWPRLALLAEAWRGQGAGGTGFLGALGGRYLGRRWSLDAGLAASSSGTLLPFASLAVTLAAP